MPDMYIKPVGPTRLNLETWSNIFRNLAEDDSEVEVSWLDPGDSSEGEWCLHSECEMFEDGFKSEKDAQARLNEVEKLLEEEKL